MIERGLFRVPNQTKRKYSAIRRHLKYTKSTKYMRKVQNESTHITKGMNTKSSLSLYFVFSLCTLCFFFSFCVTYRSVRFSSTKVPKSSAFVVRACGEQKKSSLFLSLSLYFVFSICTLCFFLICVLTAQFDFLRPKFPNHLHSLFVLVYIGSAVQERAKSRDLSHLCVRKNQNQTKIK